uniref:Serine/threonine-protein kinase ATR n=1 Tax=Anopheles farauti TaxID=69004 RepID=A0A182Q7R9_9DIPT
MDFSEDKQYSVEDTENMWKTLVITLTDMVNEHGKIWNLEKILNMIRTDITYDDPGLFPNTLLVTDAERQKCREFNYWLMYQLLRIASTEEYLNISESYTSLLKETMRACFIKQRWLALEISNQFTKLLDHLNDYRHGQKKTVDVFIGAFNDVRLHGHDLRSDKIEIDNTVRCRLVRMQCLHAITESMSMFMNDGEEDSVRFLFDSMCAVQRTFSFGNMQEKIVCVTFFRDFLKYNGQQQRSICSPQMLLNVMNLVAESLNRLKKWISSRLVGVGDIGKYLIALKELFSTLNALQTCSKTQQDASCKLKTVVTELLFSTKQLSHQLEPVNQPLLEKLIQELMVFFKKIYPPQEAGTVLATLTNVAEVLTQLDDVVVDEMVKHFPNGQTGTHDQKNISVHQTSSVWAMVMENIVSNNVQLEHALVLANEVKFKANAKLSEAIKGTHDIHFVFFDSIPALQDIESRLKSYDAKQTEWIDLSVSIIHLADCQLLSSNQQRTLLTILFSPFEEKPFGGDGTSIERSWKIATGNDVCRYALLKLCALQNTYLHKEVAKGGLNDPLMSLLKFIVKSGDCEAARKVLLRSFKQLVLSCKIHPKALYDNVFLPLCSAVFDDSEMMVDVIGIFKLFCCTRSNSFRVYQITASERSFTCHECEQPAATSTTHVMGFYLEAITEQLKIEFSFIELDRHMKAALVKTMEKNDEIILLAWASFVPAGLKHSFACLMKPELVTFWMRLFGYGSTDVYRQLCDHLPSILQPLASNLQNDPDQYGKCIASLIEQLLCAVKICITRKTAYAQQMVVLRMVVEFADVQHRTGGAVSTTDGMETLLHCVRMTIFLLMHPESLVTYEASLAIAEMCARQQVSPWKILSWYRHDVIKLLIGIAVSNHCLAGINLYQSLTVVSHTFECRDPEDFMGKNYKIITAMLLPWCLRFPKCDKLLREVAIIVRKNLAEMLSTSFLTIYTYLCISESVDVTKKCIDYIMKLTGNSFFHLLHSDIKRTVSEVLIFYHINAECVMHAIRSLLSKDSDSDEVPTARIAEYIAERFLGVLANFEGTLVNPDGEKVLKRQALLSLGDIIRLLGGEHITPFRFKIIALLRTALALSEEAALTCLCVQAWRIFVCTVDVRQLGSLLSTIFVTLEPLLDSYPEDIGYVFRYLVVENTNLLGNCIGDLFFLEDTNVPSDVKKTVATRLRKHDNEDRSERFVLRLEELIRHCNHENLKIRAFALSHLCRLFESNRAELNEAILGQHQRIGLGTVATLVETIVRGLCEQDTNLQQRAAECLGELGALAPSHLPPNYAPAGLGFAMSIHSDCFAIIALRELCRAYQRQKDSKFVDSFSLAIQEILSERGVAPAAGKKREVWETIPERLRPIMEPLLTSCYTTVSKESLTTLHPVFNNVHSSHEWSYHWASQMIESIGRKTTRNLLRAFKPSLRCDRGTLLMMMPYILVHSLLLCEGGEQIPRIVEELQTVLNAAIAQPKRPCSTTAAALMEINDAGAEEEVTFTGALAAGESIVCMTQESQDTSGKELALQCAKYAFGLFDFLERWRRQYVKETTANRKENQTNQEGTPSQQDYEVIDAFLNNFDSDLLATVNFKCHEYARALQYVERGLTGEDRGKKLQDKLSFLAEIYSRLGDTDSVEGVMALKATEPTLPEQILYHNATGRLHEAVACYERLLQLKSVEEQPPNREYLNSMIECYLRLDQPETALLLAESLLARYHDTALHIPLLDIQAEPLYRLGRFEELEELLHQRQADQVSGTIDSDDRHWGVICGSLIIEYRKPVYERFRSEIERARLHVVRGSSNERISSRPLDEQLGTYEKRYEQALKLHIIHEFAKCGHILQSLRSIQQHTDSSGAVATTTLIEDVRRLVDNLNTRLEVLQPNAATIEPIISLRRVLLQEMRQTVDEVRWKEGTGNETNVGKLRQLLDQTIGELWMKSTELASRANMYQQALLYILHAESYRPPDLFIKNANLLHDRGDMTGALKVLERGVNEIVSDTATGSLDMSALKSVPKELRLIYAEGKRLIATYNAEASNISATLNRRYFKEAVDLNPESEIALVQLAQYIDKLYGACPASEQETANGWEMLFEVMKSYGKSMQYGSKYIYESMPRVLSIWLDTTAKVLQKTSDAAAASLNRKIAQSMNKLAGKFKDTLSPYFFFTAFSQLISRVAHPSQDTYVVLKGIIVKLLLNYPQQTLWMMLSVYKSSYTNRVRRCVEIFNDRQLAQVEEMQKLIKDFNALAERLIDLTNREIPGSAGATPRGTSGLKVTVSGLVKSLPKLLAEKNFSNVLMPIERCMQLVLNKNTGLNFKPYPTNAIYIAGIEEEVTVLHSLQKPRKVTLRGHNGKLYTMMMKPKDDLRKDFRLMEFNAVVKQYLAQDPDAKFRRLYIRTYAVLPLNEECGIIEWVSNVNTFRGIVFTYYKQRGLGIATKELCNYNFSRTDSLAKKRQAFETVLVARHPPVFREWFRDCFPNPHNWFQARTSYIKTTAVISMVGYILGLGDRHGENIMFDSTNGDTVHVDFNCLFNRGETFQIPEVVPFRLTHNMVDAMGPLGVEGLYRRCCEIVLRILQTRASTFMSVLKPFVYDPMVSWSKIGFGQGESSNRDNQVERTDPQAMRNVLSIEERLKGYVKIKGKLSHIPLSIEGQVSHLIKEATDVDNLAQMYIGWSGFI